MHKNTKFSILEMTLIILISFSPLLSNVIKAGLTMLIIFVNLKVITKKISIQKIFLLIFLMSLFLLSAVYDFKNISSISYYSVLNLYIPACFLLGYMISEKYSYYEYLILIDKIVYIVALFSLIGVLIYTFLPNIINFLPSYQYYHTTNKTAFIFNVRYTESGYILLRNTGIAWEPGAFQFLLNIGLYSYLKTTIKTDLFKMAIYALAILTTKSTAGIIIFILLTFKLFLTDKRARILIIVSIAVFGGLIAEELKYHYRFKLFDSYAFETRLEPLLNSFYEGSNYFFGMGNSGYNMQLNNLNIGAYDSFGQIFIRYGYPMLITIIGFLTNILFHDKMIFIIITVTFWSQSVWFFPIVIPFYFMLSKKNNYNDKIKKIKLTKNY